MNVVLGWPLVLLPNNVKRKGCICGMWNPGPDFPLLVLTVDPWIMIHEAVTPVELCWPHTSLACQVVFGLSGPFRLVSSSVGSSSTSCYFIFDSVGVITSGDWLILCSVTVNSWDGFASFRGVFQPTAASNLDFSQASRRLLLVPSSLWCWLCQLPRRLPGPPVDPIVNFIDCPRIDWEFWPGLDWSQGHVWFSLQWPRTVGSFRSPVGCNHGTGTWRDRDVFLSHSWPFSPCWEPRLRTSLPRLIASWPIRQG